MFENLVSQDGAKFLISDIMKGNFPGAVLFSGNQASGKLSAALEVARIYSCEANPKGLWACTCPSCLRHKSLTCTNIQLLGPRDCSLEIAAAKDTFLRALKENQSYLNATRYLFVRSIRKLTLRFSSILMKGDPDINKVGAIMEGINDNLELLDYPRNLPPYEETEKICNELEKQALKLEDNFLPDTIPVSYIRNFEEWAATLSESGKKTIIIENAERMSNSVRNALLKTLEEPPQDCIFILLTSRKNSIIPTILSRLRTYEFKERSPEIQQKVIRLVFHKDNYDKLITDYLLSYLPVPLTAVQSEAERFYTSLVKGSIPDVQEVIKNCNNFEPRIELQAFLRTIAELQKNVLKSEAGCEASAQTLKTLRETWDNITLYNQSVTSAFEILVRELNKINVTHGRILCADM